MTHRLESVAVGACRRLGRSQPSLRRNLLLLRSDASISTSTTPAAMAPQLITSSRIRPASMASFSTNEIIAGSHCRQFHFTTTTRNNEGGSTPTPAAPAPPAAVNTAPFASPKVEALFQKILWLDMVEIHLLAELINEKLGITISDAERERMARGAGGGKRSGGDDAPAAAEVVAEKTIFDIKLTGFDAKNKIKVIKEVRALTNLGLKEAKELVEGVPATLKKNVKKEEAEELKAKLAELGAQVDIV